MSFHCRQNRNSAQLLHLSDDARLAQSNFNFNYPLAIYLHGFSESATGERQSSQELKDGEWRMLLKSHQILPYTEQKY